MQGVVVGTESCMSSSCDDPQAAATVSGTSCWFKGVVLLQKEIAVKEGDSVLVSTFADLQNFVRTPQKETQRGDMHSQQQQTDALHQQHQQQQQVAQMAAAGSTGGQTHAHEDIPTTHAEVRDTAGST